MAEKHQRADARTHAVDGAKGASWCVRTQPSPLSLCGSRAAGRVLRFAETLERPPIPVKNMTVGRFDAEPQSFSGTNQEFAGELHDNLRLTSCQRAVSNGHTA